MVSPSRTATTGPVRSEPNRSAVGKKETCGKNDSNPAYAIFPSTATPKHGSYSPAYSVTTLFTESCLAM